MNQEKESNSFNRRHHFLNDELVVVIFKIKHFINKFIKI